MPDTPITDPDLIKNAELKARLLGLNSFLVWNVAEAVLYVQEHGTFVPKKAWAPVPGVTRDEVESRRTEWEAFLGELIDVLNDFLDNGIIRPKSAPDILGLYGLADMLLSNTEAVAQALRDRARVDGRLNAETRVWWASSKAEFVPETDRWRALAKVNIIHWFNKLIFAHYLKRFRYEARVVDKISKVSTPRDALDVFLELSRSCDFAHVFSAPLGSDVLDPVTWARIQELNGFLGDLRLESVDQAVLHELLERAVYASARKLMGQYSTHPRLAQLLVQQTMLDNTDYVLDPFCGTGTIAKAALTQKIRSGLTMEDALETVWASDKYALPVQLATIALSEASGISRLVHVFQHDALALHTGKLIDFRHPDTGEMVRKPLPLFRTIVANLPFVQFEDVRIANPDVYAINRRLRREVGMELPRRADLYAYLPFYLWDLLAPDGRLGIIMSNSWLGTEWGEVFRTILTHYYHIESVTVSQNGRWFANADVVTTLVVLVKRPTPGAPAASEQTKFVYLKARIDRADEETISELAARTIVGSPSPAIATRTRTREEIENLERFGLPWCALFADLSWFARVSTLLAPVRDFFHISRGTRRGWDRLFYPPEDAGIEPDFLKPVLKSPRSIRGLIAAPDGQAFCCSLSVEELKRRGAFGALEWIRRFETARNTTGEPLPQVLQLPGRYWYEMDTSTLADLVMLINYDQRLFVAKLVERSFVNQRLAAFIAKAGVDVDLCHALLNSLLGLFYIEALGFGRGLAALDLNATKIRTNMWMLDPRRLTQEAASSIKRAFAPLVERPVGNLEDELQSEDRRRFDETVLAAYGLADLLEPIRASLLELYRIRRAARM